jgi:hypothetical protein
VQVQCQSKLGNIYFIHLKDFIQYLDEKIIHLVRIGSGWIGASDCVGSLVNRQPTFEHTLDTLTFKTEQKIDF